jgi:hypothetical protein
VLVSHVLVPNPYNVPWLGNVTHARKCREQVCCDGHAGMT